MMLEERGQVGRDKLVRLSNKVGESKGMLKQEGVQITLYWPGEHGHGHTHAG